MPFPWEECEREEVARSPASYHLRQGDAVRHNAKNILGFFCRKKLKFSVALRR